MQQRLEIRYSNYHVVTSQWQLDGPKPFVQADVDGSWERIR